MSKDPDPRRPGSPDDIFRSARAKGFWQRRVWALLGRRQRSQAPEPEEVEQAPEPVRVEQAPAPVRIEQTREPEDLEPSRPPPPAATPPAREAVPTGETPTVRAPRSLMPERAAFYDPRSGTLRPTPWPPGGHEAAATQGREREPLSAPLRPSQPGRDLESQEQERTRTLADDERSRPQSPPPSASDPIAFDELIERIREAERLLHARKADR